MIIIAGKNEIALHGLSLIQKIVDKNEIGVIVNKNDDGVDRWQPSLLKAARKLGVNVYTLEEVYGKKIDLFLSLEFDQIVDPEKLSTDKIFNFHFSILPKYKGMYTSVWPVLNGDKSSGVSLHLIDRGIDTGAIIRQEIFDLNENDRSQDCYRKYPKNSKKLLSDEIENIISGSYQTVDQSWLGASYYPKNSINFFDLKLNLNQTAWQVQRQLYAFSFRPYQLLEFKGERIVELTVSESKSTKRPGHIYHETSDNYLISTVDFDITLHKDRLNRLLESIPTASIEQFKLGLLNIAGVNDRNEFGWSPIIVAAYHGRLDLIDYLLGQGADINDTNYRGTSVLMYAKDFSIKASCKEYFRQIIELGADPELLDYSGRRVFDYLTADQKKFLSFDD